MLLGVPALVQQVIKLGGGEVLLRDTGLVKHHRGHEQIDVIAAQVAQPVRGQDFVGDADDIDQGGVEGTSSQVVYQDPGTLGGNGRRLAVRVLEAGGTGLVEHGGDAEASRTEGLESQQPLGSVGVGGYRDNRAGTADVQILLRQLGLEVMQVTGENLQNGEGPLTQEHRSGGCQRG